MLNSKQILRNLNTPGVKSLSKQEVVELLELFVKSGNEDMTFWYKSKDGSVYQLTLDHIQNTQTTQVYLRRA